MLAEKYSFEPYTAFKRITLVQNTDITSRDLSDFFLDNSICIDQNDASELIKQFDSNRDGKLSYNEYRDLFG